MDHGRGGAKRGDGIAMNLSESEVKSVLTRASGYLTTVSSHSLQPYRGCSFGRSLCGVGCYVRHNQFLLRGAEWGSFLEARTNAADAYLGRVDRERRWARRSRGRFTVFLSSSTDPFVPQERRWRITRSVLDAMLEEPPDELIVQTHGVVVLDEVRRLRTLAERCDLRVHLSIETDRDRLPGLPPPAAPVRARLDAAAQLRSAGIRVVVTVSPLLPIEQPDRFFAAIAERADAVVLDHYIGGDGSSDGARTARTGLPAAIEAVDPSANRLEYRERMVEVARRWMPGRVGVHIDGLRGPLPVGVNAGTYPAARSRFALKLPSTTSHALVKYSNVSSQWSASPNPRWVTFTSVRSAANASELHHHPGVLRAALRLGRRCVPGEADHPVRHVAEHLAAVAAVLPVEQPLVSATDRQLDVGRERVAVRSVRADERVAVRPRGVDLGDRRRDRPRPLERADIGATPLEQPRRNRRPIPARRRRRRLAVGRVVHPMPARLHDGLPRIAPLRLHLHRPSLGVVVDDLQAIADARAPSSHSEMSTPSSTSIDDEE